MPRTTLKPSPYPHLIAIRPVKRVPLADTGLRAIAAGIRE